MSDITLDLAPEVELNLRQYADDRQVSADDAASELVARGLDEWG